MCVHRLKQIQPMGKIAWYDATKQFPFHKVAILTDLLDSLEHWNVKVNNIIVVAFIIVSALLC